MSENQSRSGTLASKRLWSRLVLRLTSRQELQSQMPAVARDVGQNSEEGLPKWLVRA